MTTDLDAVCSYIGARSTVAHVLDNLRSLTDWLVEHAPTIPAVQVMPGMSHALILGVYNDDDADAAIGWVLSDGGQRNLTAEHAVWQHLKGDNHPRPLPEGVTIRPYGDGWALTRAFGNQAIMVSRTWSRAK